MRWAWIGLGIALAGLAIMLAWVVYEEIKWGDDTPAGLGKWKRK